ncbi:hypothetical protein BDQ17DRAFT_1365920 [Cyathus striatus]|nr:hypothetical protein BDQ17DRAFT_1365920 [Cyathus striatus]
MSLQTTVSPFFLTHVLGDEHSVKHCKACYPRLASDEYGYFVPSILSSRLASDAYNGTCSKIEPNTSTASFLSFSSPSPPPLLASDVSSPLLCPLCPHPPLCVMAGVATSTPIRVPPPALLSLPCLTSPFRLHLASAFSLPRLASDGGVHLPLSRSLLLSYTSSRHRHHATPNHQ